MFNLPPSPCVLSSPLVSGITSYPLFPDRVPGYPSLRVEIWALLICLFVCFVWERQREDVRERGIEREKERSRVHLKQGSCSPDVGLELMNLEIMT